MTCIKVNHSDTHIIRQKEAIDDLELTSRPGVYFYLDHSMQPPLVVTDGGSDGRHPTPHVSNGQESHLGQNQRENKLPSDK